MRESSPWAALQGQIFMGREDFPERVKVLIAKQSNFKEIPRIQRYAHRPNLTKLLGSTKTIETRERNKKIYEAHVKFGYTMKEISDCLSIHYTTVSKAIKDAESEN